ncbi:MAG: hypothetical protein E7592_01730 [Ruminococcaceae bacterium]|nr:hypothetical protein [Oscillospiraceae bacterium]
MSENKKIKHDSFQIAMCIAVACILTVVAFSLYCERVPEIVKKLTDDGKYTNLKWLLEHAASFFPVPLVALVITVFYSNHEKYVPVHSRKEQVFIACAVAVFTYTVMLGYVLVKHGEASGEEVETLWDIGAKWFFAQIIPFCVLIAYHSARVGSEEKELQENGDEKKRVGN